MIELETALFASDAWSPELMVAEVSYPESYYLVAKPHGRRTLWWAMRGFAPLASTPSRVIFRPLRSLPLIVAEAWVAR